MLISYFVPGYFVMAEVCLFNTLVPNVSLKLNQNIPMITWIEWVCINFTCSDLFIKVT